MQRLRRFEIMVPLHFNDGTAVPKELLEQTQSDLEARFGAVSSEGQVIRGFDRETGTTEDRLVRYFIDVPDTPENLDFFCEEKERLKERFRQKEIWIATHLIEVL
ncbi:MAG: hypothetical protein ACO1QR_03420 [Chthoniobacteraceae bacterium]